MAQIRKLKEPLPMTHPELVKEWDYEKNASLSPEQVTAGSGKKVFWLCSRGHKYEASIAHRTNGRGCPYCSGKIVVKGETDLTTTNPDLAKEWNYDRNGDLNPDNITSGSGKKVWWKCSRGHEWEAAIYSRASGRSCPYCAGKIPIKGETDLETLRPDIANEWNYKKNKTLIPCNVTVSGAKKVWWTCPNGHEYQARIADRTNGNGCPVCSGKTVLKGFNDLASSRPEIAAEWNYDKNHSLLPEQVTASSSLKVWWICSKGHEWEAPIYNRNNGRNCPFCSNKTVLPNYNDFASAYPELAREWNYEKNKSLINKLGVDISTPEKVSVGSNQSVWWKCNTCGHEWQASPARRARTGSGCPVCGAEKQRQNTQISALNRLSNLQNVYPELAKEWHPTLNGNLTPADVTPRSVKKVWWLCPVCDNAWITSVDKRQRTGCPYCAHRKIQSGTNDLQTLNPELAKEWHPTKNGSLTPSDVSPFSNKKVWWSCPVCGHEWRTSVGNRAIGRGCPSCSAEKHTSFPEQVVFFYLSKCYTTTSRYDENKYEIDVFLPDLNSGIEYDGIYYHNSNKSKERENKKDQYYKEKGIRVIHIKESSENRVDGDIIYYLVNKDYSYLSWAIINVLILLGNHEENLDIDIVRDIAQINNQYIKSRKENSLATKYPDLIKEWNSNKNGIDPTMVAAYSNKKAWWICSKCNAEFVMPIATRSAGRGCPYCGKQRALPGVTDLQTVNPILAKEWNYDKNKNLKNKFGDDNSTPNMVLPSSNQKVWWKCTSGHEWLAAVYSRNSGIGCPYCSGKIAIKGETDLSTTNPNLAKEWNYDRNGDLNPENVTAGSSKKVWWKCSKGHEWQAVIMSRSSGKNCPYCSGRIAVKGENDLFTINPQLAQEWNYEKNSKVTPGDVTANSAKKVWWKCSKGHEWRATISSRSRGSGCPCCSGRSVISGETDLATLNPELAKEWNYEKNGELSPSNVTKFSNRKVWWKCSSCGYEWLAQISARSLGSGCKHCSNRKTKPVECVETGKTYKNANEAAKQTGIRHINECCKGKVRVAGGYHWRYIDG